MLESKAFCLAFKAIGCGWEVLDDVLPDVEKFMCTLYAQKDSAGVNILNWFRSYLSNRKQYVHLQGTDSKTESVTCGVPQGSILGPLLFIIYANDISEVSNKIFPILLADDTTILMEGNSIHNVIASLNIELHKLNVWLKANKLSINVAKTHCMSFHRTRRKEYHNNITLKDSTLMQVNCIKFLGVILDDKLKLIQHISYIKNKIAKGMGIILKARKVLKKTVLYQFYNSFVFPYLIYCSEVWGTASNIHLQPLIKLQKKIIRIIKLSPYNSSTKLIFKKLNILPLFSRSKNLYFIELVSKCLNMNLALCQLLF